MAKKFEIKAVKDEKVGGVTIVGLDEIFHTGILMENLICEYEAFAEDVMMSILMPEVPRYKIVKEGDGEEGIIDQARGILYEHMSKYRKILAWLERNKIDINTIVGDGDDKVKS